MNHITVAYAIAEDYEYAMISMLSLLASADETTFYHIAVLVDDTFPEELKPVMREHLSKYSCWDMNFYSVKDTFANAKSHVEWIRPVTFYRLLLPGLLPDLERCIYLDADTIVCRDLWAVFQTPMENCYLAGVKAPGYLLNENPKEYCSNAGLPDLQNYFNAGVLLMNLEKMRRDNLTDKFLALIPLNLPSQDQDILNRVCYGKVVFLPFCYNVMTKYVSWKYEEYPRGFSQEELAEAWSTPVIIHYADRVKPWNDPSCTMGDYWWSVCRSSGLWDYFYKKLENWFFENCVYKNSKEVHSFSTKKQSPLFDYAIKKKVALYGAGQRARVALNYLRGQGVTPEFILVSSKEGNEDYIDNIPVYSLDEISRDNQDTLLVIGTSERFHPDIVDSVREYHFDSVIPMSDQYN